MPARFTLDDAEEINREHPETFFLPEAKERKTLTIGDLVKLIFRIDLGESVEVERMWVRVTGIEGKSYTGVLDNDAYCSQDVHAGMPVSFRPKHVIQIWRDQQR